MADPCWARNAGTRGVYGQQSTRWATNRSGKGVWKAEQADAGRKGAWASTQRHQVIFNDGSECGGARGVLSIRSSRCRTCPGILAISGGSSIQAITLSVPPPARQKATRGARNARCYTAAVQTAIKNDDVQQARAALKSALRTTRWLRRLSILLAMVIVALLLAIRFQA